MDPRPRLSSMYGDNNWDLNIGHEKEKTRFLDNLSLLRKLSQIHLTSMLLDGIVLI